MTFLASSSFFSVLLGTVSGKFHVAILATLSPMLLPIKLPVDCAVFEMLFLKYFYVFLWAITLQGDGTSGF